MNVCIAVATYGDRIHNFKLPSKVDGIGYLIVHQHHHDVVVPKFLERDDVKYLTMEDVGISKSRNFAIRNSDSDYLYFMDDDTEIFPVNIYDLCRRMRTDSVAVATAEFMYENGSKKKYRDYFFKHNKLSLAGVSSIEICIDKKLAGSVYFDERFGLGSDYPSGEEYIYLNSLLNIGVVICHYPVVTSVHPVITSGQDFFSSPSKILAKKMMIIEVFPKAHFLVRCVFFIKKSKVLVKNRKLFSFFRLFLF